MYKLKVTNQTDLNITGSIGTETIQRQLAI